jgi:PAS domain S-box-containing protein
MNKTTVLIVEDEAIVAADLAGKLGQLGYEVVATAATGEEAVELACHLMPRVVLMDIWLKGPMDGIEAAEAIRHRIDVPVIYLTAHSDSATLTRAKLTGPFGYVLKPFEERELATTIEMALYKHQAEQELRRSRDELEMRVRERTTELEAANVYNRSLIEASVDPLVTISPNGKITDVNSATEEATGRTRTELTGTDFCDYFNDPEKARIGYEKVFREGLVRDYPLELRHRDGRLTSVHYNASVYCDEKGEVIGVFAAARDISEQKKAQEALRELNDTLEEQIIERTAQLNSANESLRASRVAALNLMEDAIAARKQAEEANGELLREIVERKRAERELLRLNRAHKALSDCCQAVIRAQAEPELLNTVCGIIVEVCRYSMVWIGFAENDEAKSVLPVVCAGSEDGYLDTLNVTWADAERGRGPTGTAIRTGNVATCTNMVTDPAFKLWREEAIKRGYASSIALPLIGDDKVFGAITMYSPDADPFSEGEVKLLAELADNVSYGINTLRMRAAQKEAEDERETFVQFLHLVNQSRSTADLVRGATTFFQEKSGCEAVGIRLKEEDDYPYFEAHGFPEEFLIMENHLCEHDENGSIIRDGDGNPVIDCMCGNVILGRFDPSQSFFTFHGSFWTNSTSMLLSSSSEEECQARTRNRCNGEGYESVALIPLRLGDERLGLLQLNDRRQGRFSPQAIALWERLSCYLTVALTKFKAEEALQKAHDELEIKVEERTAELREKDQILLQQSRQAAMGEMIGNIAHQWRQPLNTLSLIIGMLPMMQETGELTSEQLVSMEEKATGIIQHMSQTINDFSNYFKQDKEKLPFRAGDAVAKTLTLIEDSFRHREIAIEVNVEGDPVINGYPNEFSQVLLNILLNARDALLEREVNDPKVVINMASEDGRAVMTVTDNAGGIPEEIIDKIFDPYFSTKGPEQGTGVGLFMSKGIIEKNMGGRLTVRNTGSGAEFRIEV